MKLKILTILIASAGLSGCFPLLESGYTESDMVKAAFRNLVPPNTSDEVFRVGVCELDDDVWRTVIRFDDGVQYLYTLTADNSTVTLHSVSTSAQRKNGGIYNYRPQYECDDMSVYRFIYSIGLRAEVATSVMVNHEFGDRAKVRVAGAAMAVTAAMKAHASFVPKESTW